MTIAGIILIILGNIIRYMGIRELKRNFSPYLKRPDEIITTGIYRIMRHPCYIGSIIFVAGVGLISLYFALLIVCVTFYIDRIFLEESIMPLEYSKYKERVGVFYPKFWRKNGDI
jgi:protein-S-isoprenylcysteine O-methyltransferase